MKLGSFLLIPLLLLAGCTRNDKTGLYQEIKSVDKMVVATMAISKVAKIKDNHWWNLGQRRVAVYSYNAYMRAYIDMSALQMEDLVFDDDAKTVKVYLPPVVTEIIGRDMEMNSEYENIELGRREITPDERAQMKEEANADFKKEVVDNAVFRNQLTEAAKRKARKYFETVFEANGYTASIEFKSSNLLPTNE